jgi:hypothetical protein
VFWSIETKGGEIEGFFSFYTPSGVCWWSAKTAATAGRGVGVAVSSSCACTGGDEDEDVRLVFIQAKGHGLVLGCEVALAMGCCWTRCWASGWATRPDKPGKVFFFLSFLFCFHFLF